MSTRHVILGLLREQPGHPYDVALRFGRRLEPWQVNRGQVYRTFDSLSKEGLIEEHDSEGLSERSGPSWRLTSAGDAELNRWYGHRSEDVEPLRSDLLAKLAVSGPSDRLDLLHALDWYERELTAQIQADVTARRTTIADDSWTGDIERCVADAALLHHDAELAWVHRVREVVKSRIDQAGVTNQARDTRHGVR